jgi:hypothetical protein
MRDEWAFFYDDQLIVFERDNIFNTLYCSIQIPNAVYLTSFSDGWQRAATVRYCCENDPMNTVAGKNGKS